MPDGEISRHKREPEDWLTGVTTVKETCPVAAELSQSHRSYGALQYRQQFSCRMALQAALADCIIGFKVAGHV